jgi:hypothetical protein
VEKQDRGQDGAKRWVNDKTSNWCYTQTNASKTRKQHPAFSQLELVPKSFFNGGPKDNKTKLARVVQRVLRGLDFLAAWASMLPHWHSERCWAQHSLLAAPQTALRQLAAVSASLVVAEGPAPSVCWSSFRPPFPWRLAVHNKFINTKKKIT